MNIFFCNALFLSLRKYYFFLLTVKLLWISIDCFREKIISIYSIINRTNRQNKSMDKENVKAVLNQPSNHRVSSSYNQSLQRPGSTGIRGGGGSYVHLIYGCLSAVCIWCIMEECC
ncbi:unnamed protein product [Rotaria magnacalcarata]